MGTSLEIPAPPPLDRRWRRGLQSLRALFDDSDDTEKAIDFEYAVGRPDFERSFQRLVASPHGRRLLDARPSLVEALTDREALAAMPDGSFGRAYLSFLEEHGFQSMSLLELQCRVEARWEAEEGVLQLDEARAWFRDRYVLAHDLLHVLTQYGTDDTGEATLLAFCLAQDGGPGRATLTLGAALEVAKRLGFYAQGFDWLRYDLRAWLRGRRASYLAAAPWEDLLPLDLETVRSLLGIEPAGSAHPRGILAANFDKD